MKSMLVGFQISNCFWAFSCLIIFSSLLLELSPMRIVCNFFMESSIKLDGRGTCNPGGILNPLGLNVSELHLRHLLFLLCYGLF